MNNMIIGYRVCNVQNGIIYPLNFIGGNRYPFDGHVIADCSVCGMAKSIERCTHGIYSMAHIDGLMDTLSMRTKASSAIVTIAHHGDVVIGTTGFRSNEATILMIHSDAPVSSEYDATIVKLTAQMRAGIKVARKALTTKYDDQYKRFLAIRAAEAEARIVHLAKLEKEGITDKRSLMDYIYLARGRGDSLAEIAHYLADLGACEAILTSKQKLTKLMRKFTVGDAVRASRDAWITTKRGVAIGSFSQRGGNAFIVLTLDGRIGKYSYAEKESK